MLGALAVDAQTPDPAQRLAGARSRVLATLDKVRAISCIETIERTYLRPSSPVHKTCGQLHVADTVRSALNNARWVALDAE